MSYQVGPVGCRSFSYKRIAPGRLGFVFRSPGSASGFDDGGLIFMDGDMRDPIYALPEEDKDAVCR